MYPDLFSVGSLTIHTYGLFIVVGIIVALLVAIWNRKRHGINTQQVMDLGFIVVFSAFIGARLLYVLIHLSYYKEDPLDVLKVWQGGLVFSGGLLAALLAISFYLFRHHLSLWKTGDFLAPSVAIGQAIGRIGCFMAGCCYGKPTIVKWGVVFHHPDSLAPLYIPLHPTQLYAALSGFIIFIVLMILRTKKQFEGQVLLWFLILHCTGRLIIERFRGDDRGLILGGDMSLTQLIALLLLFASVGTLIALKSRQKEK
ncbi:MAG: prolipoprotein diacylglyceryl transferase [Deltaproteobacteria bacterium]|nr:prolipoprotein diacylglyceryl transferase [Deltaproteobacteria bacterium]